MKRALWVFAVLLTACGAYKPPAPPAPRDATDVTASASRTWDAVIDVFAAQNIPIRTVERTSGIIATEQLTVGPDGKKWADCGTESSGQLRPNAAIYNVLVRGDSASATVKATVRWTRVLSLGESLDCSTTDVWERNFEADVKARAEDPTVVYRGAAADEGPQTIPEPGMPAHASGTTASGSPGVAAPAGKDGAPPLADRVGRFAEPTGNERSNNDLLTYPGFRRAIGDLERKRMLLGYRELAWSHLEVDLSATAFNEPTLEYLLTQVYLGYSQTMGGNAGTRLTVRAGPTTVGEYTRRGMQWQ